MIRLGGYHGPSFARDPEVIDLRSRLFEYLRRPKDERAQRRVPVHETFFYQERVREPVAERANFKCAFCEAPPTGDEFVDHFRPIAEARDLSGTIADDFYAWLAYEPENWIFSCRECAYNRGSTFPVEEDRAPFIALLAEVRRLESPLLVDPYVDYPDRHFDFLVNGKCVPLTPKGAVTASVVGLNREGLIRQRQEVLKEYLGGIESTLLDGQREIFDALFNPRWPFLGARLNLLKRALEGVSFRGARISGPLAGLPEKLRLASLGFSRFDVERFQNRIQELRRDDEERERERDQELYGAVPPDLQIPPIATLAAPAALPRTGGIAALEVSAFKGIQGLRLTIPSRTSTRGAPCLMLLGENSTGKSSLLQAIALSVIGGGQARRLKITPEEIFRNRSGDRWDQLTPQSAHARVQFNFSKAPAEFLLDAATRRIVTGQPPAALVLGYGPRRFFDPRKSTRGPEAWRRVQTLFDAVATIPYPGTWLNQISGRQFDQVAQVLRIVLALEEDDELVRDVDQRICVRLRQRTVPIEWLSEGYRSIFSLVVDIVRELSDHFSSLQEAEAIVLIDEIETHLHPRWKMQVMSSLRRALPNVQFIVTTHDPLCLRGMEDGEIVVLQTDADGQVAALNDLPSIKGMRADQLLTSDYFGLSSTVDPETELALARLSRAGDQPPIGDVAEAEDLVARLTIGDGAREQVIHEALNRFIEERDRPTGRLRPEVREEAVLAVLDALRSDLDEPREAG